MRFLPTLTDDRPLEDRLHVHTVVSNPPRFRRRWDLYRDFAKHVAASGATLTTIEVAFGDRPFAVTERDNPDHVQLRSSDELWLKENALDLGFAHTIQRYPYARYLAWVDADVSFARPDWAGETVHQLQHYDFVQMFSVAHDLGPDDETISTHRGFMSDYIHGKLNLGPDYCKYSHPGFAWAARRESLDVVGGLIDFAILGAGDKHMALGLIGQLDASVALPLGEKGLRDGGWPPPLEPAYIRELLDWQARAEREIRRNVGYVPGTLLHRHHGPKRLRKYVERWRILVDNEYDPDKDIKRDTQGLISLNEDGSLRIIKLRDQIRAYFRQRNEDSLEV